MKLNRLTLQNFKGVESLTVEPQGANMVIRGENGTGKTSLADAYAWVVFGKSFTGDSIEPEIKRRDPETGVTPNDGGVVHAVEVELKLDCVGLMKLRKEYVEKWEKKRGAAESEFRGHTTNYYINEVPLQKKEYDKKVGEIIPEEAGRLLSMPLYFCTNLKWQERRKILMDMSGEVPDADLLESDDFVPLKSLMGNNTIDEYRKSLKARMKKVNEELKTIPARIDELSQVDISGTDDINEVEKEFSELQTKRGLKAAEIARLENGGEAAEVRKKLSEAEAAITKFKANFEAEYTKKTGEAESTVRGCVAEVERLGEEMTRIQSKVNQLETINATTDAQAQKLREEWGVENAKEANIDISDTCPCCGQKLPQDKLEEAREKVLADFNRRKSETLTEITAKGKRMMEQKARNIEEIETGKAKLEELTRRVSELADKKAAAEKLISEAVEPDVTTSDEYWNLKNAKAALEEKIAALEQGDNSQELETARQELAAIDADLAANNEKRAAIQQAESVERRKGELAAREKELGKMYSELEMFLDLAEKFVRAKVKLTEDAINNHFKFVRFTMFRQQINGGLEECCEPTIGGVPFGVGLNTGNEMKAALDILNALSEHFKLHLPVIIDNCESYTSESIIPIENQLIRLVVSEGQKKLSIEVEGQERQEVAAISREAK